MDLVSSHPFWLLKNGLVRSYPSLRQDIRCDVLVLGAGISGAIVAQRLVRLGWDVVVVDKRDVGCGSTSASTALLQYEIDVHLIELERRIGKRDARRAYRACHASIDSIETIVTEVSAQCDFQRRSSVYLAAKLSDVKILVKECAARKAAGIDVCYLDADELRARFDFKRPGALLSRQAAQLDAHCLTHALISNAAKAGARVYDRTTIAEIEPGHREVRLKTADCFTIRAEHVVMATGYESQEYLSRKVVSLKSTFALASEPVPDLPGWWERCLLWETARPYLYLRTTSAGRVIVGGEDIPFRDPQLRDRLVDKKARRLAGRFARLFPRIPIKIDYAWAGTFGETKDGLAYIGQVRQWPRCHFALGFEGNGICYSAIAAEIIERALTGRRHPDAHLFAFDR
jgi:glycine/D-amino acid oxidase-like deaminating enzyme